MVKKGSKLEEAFLSEGILSSENEKIKCIPIFLGQKIFSIKPEKEEEGSFKKYMNKLQKESPKGSTHFIQKYVTTQNFPRDCTNALSYDYSREYHVVTYLKISKD